MTNVGRYFGAIDELGKCQQTSAEEVEPPYKGINET